MRTIGPDSTKSFRLGTSLLALLPLVPWADVQRQPSVCSVAISVTVQAPLAWGAREWRLMTREVEQIWVPYGLSICWTDDENPCPGGQVRFRVLIEPDLPGTGATTREDNPVEIGRASCRERV